MEKETLIAELKKISKGFFDKQDFYRAGRINLAIDVIEELSQTNVCNCEAPMHQFCGADLQACMNCGNQIKRDNTLSV